MAWYTILFITVFALFAVKLIMSWFAGDFEMDVDFDGIDDFDVTKDFDISTIDKALEKVNGARGQIGAQSNSLDYTIGYNTQTSYNLTKAQSGMEDTDIAKAVSEQKKQELLQTVRFIMQKREEEDMQRKASLLV